MPSNAAWRTERGHIVSSTQRNHARTGPDGEQQVRLPDLGEGLTEATLVRWLVAPGDVVAQDQIIAEVETAKATVELPSPFAGTVARCHAEEGDDVAVGAVVLSLAGEPTGQQAGDGQVGVDEPADDGQPAGDESAGDESAGDGDRDGDDGGSLLVGYGTATSRGRRRRSHGAHRPPTMRVGRPRAKPPVRKLAKDLGVDLEQVTGSGPDGRITRDDVRAASQAAVAAAGPAAAEPVAAAKPTGSRRTPVAGVRARIADHLSVAWREIPAASCWITCDATELLAVRAALARAHPDVRITPLALVLRCCVVALRDVPQLNASFDAEARELVHHDAVHLGVATQTERGLVVPVIRDAGDRSVLDLATAVGELAAAARDNTLPPAQMVGGTFTVSNFGAFGVDGGTPIVNHPEAAIVGVGRIAPRPWVVDRTVEVRDVIELSLTFDHRVCDGGEAAGFLRRLADLVEQPTLLLAH
jgi:pyruvate dehydrogenase E2 component (dihydrolipoamide acetyltransferase)